MRKRVLRIHVAIRRIAAALKDESGAEFAESALVVSLVALGAVTVADGLASRIAIGFGGLHDLLMGFVSGGSGSIRGG